MCEAFAAAATLRIETAAKPFASAIAMAAATTFPRLSGAGAGRLTGSSLSQTMGALFLGFR
jgi:hypothetical protein